MSEGLKYTPQLKKLNRHFGGSNPPILIPAFQTELPFNPALFNEIDNLATAWGEQNLVSDYYWIVTQYLRFANFRANQQPVSNANFAELVARRKAFKLLQRKGPGLAPSVTIRVGKEKVELKDFETLNAIYDFLQNHETEVVNDNVLSKRSTIADDGYRNHCGEIDDYLAISGIEPALARYRTIGYLLSLAEVPVRQTINGKYVPNSHKSQTFDEVKMIDTVKRWINSYKDSQAKKEQ